MTSGSGTVRDQPSNQMFEPGKPLDPLRVAWRSGKGLVSSLECDGDHIDVILRHDDHDDRRHHLPHQPANRGGGVPAMLARNALHFEESTGPKSAACGSLPRRAYRLDRRCGRVAEGGGLLNRYRVVKPYRGFESLRLRQPRECPTARPGLHGVPSRCSRVCRSPERNHLMVLHEAESRGCRRHLRLRVSDQALKSRRKT